MKGITGIINISILALIVLKCQRMRENFVYTPLWEVGTISKPPVVSHEARKDHILGWKPDIQFKSRKKVIEKLPSSSKFMSGRIHE
jgi:hypothetical protein